MRRLFSTLKANLSFGVIKLVLFSLGSKLSSAKFWRLQIGLAFIFFSLLPSLTEAQPMHCEPIVEEGSINFDQIIEAAAGSEEMILNIPRPVFEQTVLKLIEKFATTEGSEQEAYVDRIKAFGVEALPILEFAKDKWPALESALQSLIREVSVLSGPSSVRFQIIDELKRSQDTSEPKSCLYDANMRSRISAAVEALKKSLQDNHEGKQKALKKSIRGFIQNYEHSTCFVGNASLSHVCPLLQAGDAANVSIGPDRGAEYFWIEAKDADGKSLHLRQRLDDGKGRQFWEVFDSKGRNKKSRGRLSDYDGDGIIDEVSLHGQETWQTREVEVAWENGRVVERSRVAGQERDRSLRGALDAYMASETVLTESSAVPGDNINVDTRRKYPVDFETQGPSRADICEHGLLSNPSVLLSNLTLDIGWKLSEVNFSDDGFWRAFIEEPRRAAFVARHAAGDFLADGLIFISMLLTDSEFRWNLFAALTVAAAQLATDAAIDIGQCRADLRSELGFDLPDVLTTEFCKMSVAMGVGVDVLVALFWLIAEKATECVNIDGDPDRIATCWGQVAAFAGGSAVTGGAAGVLRGAGAAVTGTGVVNAVTRVSFKVGAEVFEFVVDPGAGSFVKGGWPFSQPRLAAEGPSAGAGVVAVRGSTDAPPAPTPRRDATVSKDASSKPPDQRPSDESSIFNLDPDTHETLQKSLTDLRASLSDAIEERIKNIEVNLIEAAKKQIRKDLNLNGQTAKPDAKHQPTIPTIDALADLRTSKAIDALAEIAKGSDPTKAKAAIAALASTNTKAAIDALARIAKGSGPTKAKAAIDALASTRTTDAIDALAKIANDSDHTVAQAAIDALASTKTKDAIDALAKIANDPDSIKAKAAIDALASTNTPEAIDALAKIANDPDSIKAKAAIDALASTNTPEAIDALDAIAFSNSPQADAAAAALEAMPANPGSAGATSSAAKAAEPASPARALTAEEIIKWANTFRLNDSTTTGLPWLNGARGLLELPNQVEKFLGEGRIADGLLSEVSWLDPKSLQANLKHLLAKKNSINNPRGFVDLLVELDVPKPAKELFEGEGGSVKAYWFADVGASKGEGSPPAVFDQAAKVSENGSETTHLIDVKRTQGDSLPPNQIASIERKIDAAKSEPSLYSHDEVEPNHANFKFTVWIVREGGSKNFAKPEFKGIDAKVDVIFQDPSTGQVTRGQW